MGQNSSFHFSVHSFSFFVITFEFILFPDMKPLQKQMKKMRKQRLCWNLIPTKYSKLSESYHVLFMADVGGQYKR